MSPVWRKLALCAHVVASVGWLGAIAAFLALALVGLAGADLEQARGAYVALEPLTWWAIVPFALAALATGLLSSLGTPWGLLEHYWVLFKLVLTLAATLVLLLHTRPIARLATAAADGTLSSAGALRTQVVVDSSLALAVLLLQVGLGVYKPRGTLRRAR
jgi:hypothetical protein